MKLGDIGAVLRDIFTAGEGPFPFVIYIDTNDWWVGYYRGPNHHYVCPVPTMVIRWRRRVTKDEAEMIKLLEAGRAVLLDIQEEAKRLGMPGVIGNINMANSYVEASLRRLETR